MSDLNSNPPDGGIDAWLQVVAAHLVVFNTWGYITSYGIFQPYYVTAFSEPAWKVSWIGSIQTMLVFLFGTLSGRAVDAGYIRCSFTAGCILQLMGVFATSFCTQFWQLFVAQGIVQGLGSGLLCCPVVTLVASYFSKRRTLAMSIGSCGSATGGIVFPVIAQQLLHRIGFGWTVRVMGFVMLFNMVVILVLVHPRIPPPTQAPLLDVSAFKELPYSTFAIGMFLAHWAIFFAYYYVRPFGLDILHVSESTSFSLLLAINAIGAPGRFIPALLADHDSIPGGTLTMLILTTFSAAICLFAWACVGSLAGDFAWVLIFGYFGAGIQSLFPAALVGFTDDRSKSGVRVGMAFGVVSVACVTGPPLAGKLIEYEGGGYLAAQAWAGTTLMIAAAVMVVAKLLRDRAAAIRAA